MSTRAKGSKAQFDRERRLKNLLARTLEYDLPPLFKTEIRQALSGQSGGTPVGSEAP